MAVIKLRLTLWDKAVGPCPVCGKKKWWYNDVPIAAFCWGTERKPHAEVKRVLKGEFQPYR